jgi:hypothetical protein
VKYGEVYDARMLQLQRAIITGHADVVPMCYVPLLLWCGVAVGGVAEQHDADRIPWDSIYESVSDRRQVVEWSSVTRPELVHALYLVDTGAWIPANPIPHSPALSFPVTCNASFFRPEIRGYLDKLRAFELPKEKTRVVLVPCSADKPYPSMIHKSVEDLLPDDSWYLCAVSGSLGVSPSMLWQEMPEYDAGLPNYERVRTWLAWYLTKHSHKEVVSYVDFYSSAVEDAWPTATQPLGSGRRLGYENLLAEEHLLALSKALEAPRVRATVEETVEWPNRPL